MGFAAQKPGSIEEAQGWGAAKNAHSILRIRFAPLFGGRLCSCLVFVEQKPQNQSKTVKSLILKVYSLCAQLKELELENKKSSTRRQFDL